MYPKCAFVSNLVHAFEHVKEIQSFTNRVFRSGSSLNNKTNTVSLKVPK